MSDILEKAKTLAGRYHAGQMYGKMPYTYHLLQVEESLYESATHYQNFHTVLAVAWLHDILEDTSCTDQEILTECGYDVAFAVRILTKQSEDVQTYEQYIAAVKANPITLEVKIHDTLCNLRASVMSGEKGRIRKYARQMELLVS